MTAYELPPGEPPDDDGYAHSTPPERLPVADKAAERALLACLLTTPGVADQLVGVDIQSTDFYWPVHQTIWDTWHKVTATNGAPADSVLVNAELLATKQADAARLLVDLLTDAEGNPPLAEHYAGLIRDHARLRTVQDLSTGLAQLAQKRHVNDIEAYLGEALQRLDDTVTRFGTLTKPASATGLHDLAWILTGETPPQPIPTYATRTDGHALFYPGKVNGIFGDPECGKTWLAQIAIVEALNNGGTAAMIDVDHNGPDHTAARLLLLGAHPHAIADPERFRYYEPEEPDELLAAVDDITARHPDVYLLDSLGEVLPMLGVSSIDNDEISTAVRRVCTPPAVAGSCVITIDHLPKSHEARTTGYAIGGTAKKRVMRGSYLRAEARTQPAPEAVGRITLRIEKDTIGELRRTSGGGYAGTLILDSTQPATTSWSIVRTEMPRNQDGTPRPTTLMERVAAYISDHEGCSQRDIEADIPGTGKYIRQALQVLVTEGHVSRIAGPRRAWFHHLEIPYLEAEDDNAE